MKTGPRSDGDHTHEPLVSRRGFPKGTAATAGILALGDLGRAGMALLQPALPSPDAEPLTERDATANNLVDVLDFASPRLKAKQFKVPTGPFGGPCPPGVGKAAMTDEWELLRAKAAGFGWPV